MAFDTQNKNVINLTPDLEYFSPDYYALRDKAYRETLGPTGRPDFSGDVAAAYDSAQPQARQSALAMAKLRGGPVVNNAPGQMAGRGMALMQARQAAAQDAMAHTQATMGARQQFFNNDMAQKNLLRAVNQANFNRMMEDRLANKRNVDRWTMQGLNTLGTVAGGVLGGGAGAGIGGTAGNMLGTLVTQDNEKPWFDTSQFGGAFGGGGQQQTMNQSIWDSNYGQSQYNRVPRMSAGW